MIRKIQLQTNLLFYSVDGGRQDDNFTKAFMEGSGSLILWSINGKCEVVDSRKLVQGTDLGLLQKDILFVLAEKFFSAAQRWNVAGQWSRSVCCERQQMCPALTSNRPLILIHKYCNLGVNLFPAKAEICCKSHLLCCPLLYQFVTQLL